MSEQMHAIIIIFVMGLVTIATRLIPVFVFGRGDKKVPDYILYLGKVVPYTAMGLLIVYCLKDVSFTGASHGLPEIIALAIVVASYLLKKNTILSVVIGTVAYMVMVQMVFV